MDWAEYSDFVKKHASPADRRTLLSASTIQYNAKFPNISLTFYSMPDYLDIFNYQSRLNTAKFITLVHEYQFVASDYHRQLTECLDAIAGLGTQGKRLNTGVALLQELAASRRHTVRIMPHWHWARVLLPGPFNATPRAVRREETLAHVSDGVFSNTADTYAKREHILDDNNMPTSDVGTGRGADIVLFYSPEEWRNNASGVAAPSFEPDEVLFHELVHVSRQFRGALTGVPVSDKKAGFGNQEEFLATTIANLYLSEKGKPLRGVYTIPEKPKREIQVKGQSKFWVIDPMPKGFAVMQAPEKFYQNPDNVDPSPRRLMQVFKDAQGTFYDALAHLPDDNPKFNPVKQHFKENQLIDI